MNENSTRGFQKKDEEQDLTAMSEQRLERLCAVTRDEIRTAAPEGGVERIEARFHGNGFSPHRHDTYALGLTMRGVQRFFYRGHERASQPGQVIVLHPDELHDGGAGTDLGLAYRMIYLPPALVAQAHGRAGLPYVPVPVLSDPTFRSRLHEALEDLDLEMGPLKLSGLLSDLAECLNRFSDDRRRSGRLLHQAAVKDCAEFLRTHCTEQVSLDEIGAHWGIDRYSLARQFRSAFGTSPHRYQLMRRLEKAKSAILAGRALADVAFACGYSDQSHMTRHFKKAYGMPPGKWQQLSRCHAGG